MLALGKKVYIVTDEGIMTRRIMRGIGDTENLLLETNDGKRYEIKLIGITLFFTRTQADEAAKKRGIKPIGSPKLNEIIAKVRDDMEAYSETTLKDGLSAIRIWMKENAEHFNGTAGVVQFGRIAPDNVVIKGSVFRLFTEMVYGAAKNPMDNEPDEILYRALWKYGILKNDDESDPAWKKRKIGGRSVMSVKLWIEV